MVWSEMAVLKMEVDACVDGAAGKSRLICQPDDSTSGCSKTEAVQPAVRVTAATAEKWDMDSCLGGSCQTSYSSRVGALDSPTHLMARGVELCGVATPPTICSVATQTDSLWPRSVWGEGERAAVSSVSESEGGSERKKKRKTRKDSLASPTRIYSGAFFRSKRLGSFYSRMDCSSRVAGELRSGMVHELPLPFAGPTVDGIEPFTSYPLALELARLGFEEDELEGKGLESREEQERRQSLLDDSGLGHELGGFLEVKSVDDKCEPGKPEEVREEA